MSGWLWLGLGRGCGCGCGCAWLLTYRGLVSFASASNAATVLRAAVRAVIASWRLSCASLRSDAICRAARSEGGWV